MVAITPYEMVVILSFVITLKSLVSSLKPSNMRCPGHCEPMSCSVHHEFLKTWLKDDLHSNTAEKKLESLRMATPEGGLASVWKF